MTDASPRSWRRGAWLPWLVLVTVVLAVSVQSTFGGPKRFDGSGLEYTRYNNFIIFRQSFIHLLAGQDLYRLYPAEYWDLYKYSPAFAILMAPLTLLPDVAGLVLWNLCNATIVCAALWSLPARSREQRMMALGVVGVELVTSLQSAQSNALIAGLLIIAFTQLERGRIAIPTLCIALTVAIKLFGLVAFALLLVYARRVRAACFAAGWLMLLAALPLLVVDVAHLGALYRSWLGMLRHDESISLGLSVAGWLFAWFGLQWKAHVLLAGVALFCLPLTRVRLYGDQRFRAFLLASVLLWVVIFNHKAESPTFVIAVAGVAIWFAYGAKSALDVSLLALTIVLTILSSTDVFPRALREAYVVPFVLKAVPCILVWVKIVHDQLTRQAPSAAPVPMQTEA